MADQTPENSPDVRAAAAASVTPDALTAAILQKHAAGQPLTPQESGKLGWWKAQLNKLTRKPGAPGSAPGPAQPGASSGNAVALASMAQAEAARHGLDSVPVDDALAQRTAGAILNRADAICVRWIDRAAREAGAVDKTHARFVAAAGFSSDDKKLMMELAPVVCEEMGINIRRLAVWTVGGILGLHATNLWLAVEELKAMNREKAKTAEPAASPAPALTLSIGGRSEQGAPGRGPTLPDPPRPAGAPPLVTGGNPS